MHSRTICWKASHACWSSGVGGPLPLYIFLIVTNVLMIAAIWRNSNRLGRQALFPRIADSCMAFYGRLAALVGRKEGAH